MLVAGSVELGEAFVGLATYRPVFHSEADLQLALAWELQRRDPEMRVRLETRPEPGTHLDVACSRPDLGRFTALELKYLTRFWSGEVAGERFELKNHGAGDVRGYDVVKDISRVERFIDGRPGWNGAAIAVSNDSYYWRPKASTVSNAAAFRLSEGMTLHGVRDWGAKTGAGTKNKREEAIPLEGTYVLHWRNYSTVSGSGHAAAEFRLLLIPVGPDVSR